MTTVETLDLLCPDAPVEIRIISEGAPLVKRFHDHIQAAAWADQYPHARGVYVLMNPYDERLIKGSGVGDDAITRRKWLLIDADPKRPTGTNSSDEELGLARDITYKVKDYLTTKGWPQPIEALSGNGSHLLYAIDLPNDARSTAAIEAILKHLDDRFNTSQGSDTRGVSIDTTVSNASRITKLYGTMTRKGPDTPERPQRISQLLPSTGPLELVPSLLLLEFAVTAPAAGSHTKTGGPGLYDLQAILARIKAYTQIFGERRKDDVTQYQIDCPWKSEHTTQPVGKDGTMFTWGDDGAPGFICGHGHCKERHWPEFRERLDIRPKFLVLKPDDPMPSAREFIRRKYYSDDIMTIHHQGEVFYVYDGVAYVERDIATVRSDLYKFLEKAKTLAGGKQGTDKKPAISAKPVPFQPNREKVANVLSALQAVCNLPTSQAAPCWLVEGMEAAGLNPRDILVCKNGLLHIPTRRLYTSTPQFYSMNGIDVEYDASCEIPHLWLGFLKTLWPDDQESIDTLQEMFGYFMTADTRQQKIAMLIGPKRSGKGTIARVLRALIGDKNACSPTLAAFGQNFGKQVLIGKTLAIISDARIGGKTDTAMVAETLLSVSGEDSQTIDRKFLTQWNGKLGVRFLILTNELPRIGDVSGALPSRFITLQLTQSFFGREDQTLFDKMIRELPGILNWALEGRDRLNERGYFVTPASSEQITREFEDLGSPEATFLKEKCEILPGAYVLQKELFDAWVMWCGENGREHPGTAQVFGRNVRAVYQWIQVKKVGGKGEQERAWDGIRLADTLQQVDGPF